MAVPARRSTVPRCWWRCAGSASRRRWRPCSSVSCRRRSSAPGSEEQGTGGLEDFVPRHADQLRADTILVCDTGNAAVGAPAVTVSLRGMVNVVVGVQTLATELHSGMFGGAAPDALAALIHMLATLRDKAGN